MSDSQSEQVDTTTIDILAKTGSGDRQFSHQETVELVVRYDQTIAEQRLNWTTHLRLVRRLGQGGQGVVYLAERRGADSFTLPVALKIFSPERYRAPEDYDDDMHRIGGVAARIARIQHDNLLLVQNFLDRNRIRMMIMEWVDGFDLRRLLTPRMFGLIKERFSEKRWDQINQVLITSGPDQPRLKPGVAVSITRSCLEAIAALHREGIVHGDIKPANVMLKRSGHAKLIDFGSAFQVDQPPMRRACTPAYAALEVLLGKENTPLSDLASVGYMLVELLSGKSLFGKELEISALINSKLEIEQRLPQLLPEEVVCNDLLMTFIRGLVAPQPQDRFRSAEEAVIHKTGAAEFQRQLVKGDLASEYENDLRIWIEELLELELTGM